MEGLADGQAMEAEKCCQDCSQMMPSLSSGLEEFSVYFQRAGNSHYRPRIESDRTANVAATTFEALPYFEPASISQHCMASKPHSRLTYFFNGPYDEYLACPKAALARIPK